MSLRGVFSTIATTAALAVATAGAGAQRAKPKPKISKDSALAIARTTVPNGTIAASEYEHEKGRWIWSVELKVPGKSGVEEVNVDAMTGKLVAHEHESAKSEAKEARAEKKATKP